jgi:undecaprenyl diphosphate synthase
MARAARRLAEDVVQGRLALEDVDEEAFALRLYTAGIPDPDLLVRTSGELRVSNFLLWQIAYTELFITPVLWPDFTRQHLYEAIVSYQGRQRRFGRVTA